MTAQPEPLSPPTVAQTPATTSEEAMAQELADSDSTAASKTPSESAERHVEESRAEEPYAEESSYASRRVR